MNYLERFGIGQEAELAQEHSLYIGLTGPPGVGKSFAGRYLDSLHPSDITTEPAEPELTKIRTLTMRYLLARHGYAGPTHITDLQRYHAEVRRSGEGSAVLDPVLAIHSSIVIIDALRHPSDVRHLKEMGGYVLGLDASLDVCKQRFVSDVTDVKHNELAGREEAWEHAIGEMDDITACLAMADVRVDATPTQNDMLAEIRNAVASLYTPVLSSVQ